MKVIGLTGGIGSGKSTVSQFLAELGAVVLNADEVGHEAFRPDTEIWREVVAAFGRQIVTPDGNIDRKKLGNIVFGNPESLSRLNQIMHPQMYDMIKAQLKEYRQQGTRVAVLEAPLLLEANWTPLVDEVWVTTASDAMVLKRLEERSGMSQAESLTRIRSQLPSAERVRQADVVINTDCDLDELKARVKELGQRLELDTLP
jgi:dephospho-CoA kinase